MNKIKIGFIYLSHIAHIHHTASIAYNLSYNEKFEVILIVSDKRNRNILKKISSQFPNHNCNIKFLKPSIIFRLLKIIRIKLCPITRDILKRNYDYLMSLDALVAPHDNLHYIKERDRGNLKLITTTHGMETAQRFNIKPKYKNFDLYLFPGKYRHQYMIENNVANKKNAKIIGYPKFDITLKIPKQKFFNNNKPIIVYAPHWNPKLSSWYEWGLQILEIFYNINDFNLFFAPHIKKIPKKFRKIPKKYYHAPHLHINKDNEALINMTYMKNAHIYLGDGSSQVCEFVIEPRPCIFLNPNKLDWKNMKGMEMWELGEVVDDINNLKNAIYNANKKHSNFFKIQKNFLEKRYSNSKISAGKRGAIEIEKFFYN